MKKKFKFINLSPKHLALALSIFAWKLDIKHAIPMALYLFGLLIFSCFWVVRQKNPIPQSLLFHIHRSWNLRCPTYFEPKRHRVDFVALQLRSETIISSSLRYFPAGSCQIKWNKTLSVSLGRWQYYRLSFNILTSQMVTNLQFL